MRTLEELKELAKEMHKSTEELLYEMIVDSMKELKEKDEIIKDAIENINIMLEVVKNNPTEDDMWTLFTLKWLKHILESEEK